MGREIRRVPPGWQHPKKDYPNHMLGRTEEGFRPLYDDDVESAWRLWLAGWEKWVGGEFQKKLAAGELEGYTAAQPYKAYCEYEWTPPEPEMYRPAWTEAEATAFQIYETVSEGTPVSPVFATKEEVVEYLVADGDFWDQSRAAEGRQAKAGWDRASAERFVNCGHAMSLIVERSSQGVSIKEPRDS